MGNYAKTKEKFLNMTFTSNNYGDFVVIEYEHCSNVIIRFINTGAVLVTNTASILRGNVKDPSVKKASGKRTTMKHCKYVGNTYSSNNYGDYVVEDIVDSEKVNIRFIDTGNVQEVLRSQITTGIIRDHSVKQVRKPRTGNIIHKVGYVGEDREIIKEYPDIYAAWVSMLQRCYSQKNEVLKRNYKDCTVSEGFKYFPTFLEWWLEKSKGIDIKLQLDKDILVKGNKIYSEDTCALVPRDINMLCIKRNKARGKYPIGVTYCKRSKKYKAQFSKFNVITNLGSHDSVESAFLAYKIAKEEYVKEVANKYKDVIEDKVYEILMKYEVDIDD